MNYKRVLVLAPHTDDAELGCGGTISRMLESGADVFIVAFSSAEESVPKGSPRDILEQEFRQATSALGIPPDQAIVYNYQVRRLSYHRQEVLEEMIRLRREIQPDLVLIPSEHDIHQDHQVVAIEGLRAFKDLSLLGYELPWNHITFSAQAFVVLEQRHVDHKWSVLEFYHSQIELKRPYFSIDFITGLARLRGVQVKANYAEAFEVVRMRI